MPFPRPALEGTKVYMDSWWLPPPPCLISTTANVLFLTKAHYSSVEMGWTPRAALKIQSNKLLDVRAFTGSVVSGKVAVTCSIFLWLDDSSQGRALLPSVPPDSCWCSSSSGPGGCAHVIPSLVPSSLFLSLDGLSLKISSSLLQRLHRSSSFHSRPLACALLSFTMIG